jgi:hypothetical protein
MGGYIFQAVLDLFLQFAYSVYPLFQYYIF